MTIASAAGDSRRLQVTTVAPARLVPTLKEDVERGFALRPRSLPPKYFYDEVGSQLFDRICDTAEYYPTRAEAALLGEHARTVIATVRPDHIIELGSGTARKTRHLLDACADLAPGVRYWPFDVCQEMLAETGEALVAEYPWLRVTALAGDYMGGLGNLPRPLGRRLFVFLGGTIGNFSELEAQQFLSELRHHMHPGDSLLLGADRVKAPEVLEAAYDDAAGVTAEFNLNLLRVLNRELDADFEVAAFQHRARYNPEAARIEMYLVSERAQRVSVAALGRDYGFAAGEAMLTEISRKFTSESLASMLAAAGLAIEAHFEGGERLFSLVLARPASRGS